ncbi:radical SAM protein [Paenibacillus sp. FSL K6-1096]|uniref:B12-binding domain-containing radical SAM protein n=1 Tax=Paenibacillus sp. FSL K6-1096 TaxID=2921460 RepID=UPI0030EB12E8
MTGNPFKVGLVVPLFCPTHEFSDMVVEYLGFGYIASYLRQFGVSVEIIEPFVERLSIEEVAERISHGKFDFLGFTLMSSDYFRGMRSILDQLSGADLENVHINVGGYYATFFRDQILQREARVHSLTLGEGERTIKELIERLKENASIKDVAGLLYRREDGIVLSSGDRRLMSAEELNELPFPARDHIDIILQRKGRIQVNSSRGCFGQCTFCAVHSYYDQQQGMKWRGRSAENVVQEIEHLVTTYGVKYIHFSDEEFVGPGIRGQERARQIAQLLLDKNLHIKFSLYCRADSVDPETFQLLAQAGLESIFLGVEFGVQSTLNDYRKGITVDQIKKALSILNGLKIRINVGFMMFEPLSTVESFRENMKFCIEHTKFTLRRVISRMAIYPYSVAYHRLKPVIDMDEELSFDDMFGDHYPYRFQDQRVEFLYHLLTQSLKVISPSIKYLEIRKTPSPQRREQLLARWSYEVYSLIDSISAEIQHEPDLTDASLQAYIQKFNNQLTAWDADGSLVSLTS